MLLALLAENSHRNGRIRDGNEEGNQGRKGRGYGRECRHPIESMVWSLDHSTVTRSIEKGKAKKAHSSNRDPTSKEVFSNIAADIGRRGVVLA